MGHSHGQQNKEVSPWVDNSCQFEFAIKEMFNQNIDKKREITKSVTREMKKAQFLLSIS